MKHLMEKLEQLLELGGIKKDVTFLVISGIAVICSLLKWNPLPFDMAWVAIVLSAAAITWAVTGQIIRAVTILVVQPVLLTGDHKNAARTIAGELQIREVQANCLPEDKLRYIGEYQAKELPHLVALSKRMMTTIKLNMTFSMTLNFIAITLAIIGTLNPVAGALVHNAGSVLVITNSAFLLKRRKK